jgi:ribosomal protein S18 acetylase RimI-like enzyme
MSTILQPIDDGDVPRIVALMNRAFRGVDAGWNTETGYITGERTNEDLIRSDIKESPGGRFLKLTHGHGQGQDQDTLLGCVWLRPLRSNEWYLGSLTTDPTHQNAGYGKLILSLTEQWIRERDGEKIRMTVINVRKTLIDWYIRRGYILTDVVEPFPYGDNRFGTPLRDDLSFVVLEKALTVPPLH